MTLRFLWQIRQWCFNFEISMKMWEWFEYYTHFWSINLPSLPQIILQSWGVSGWRRHYALCNVHLWCWCKIYISLLPNIYFCCCKIYIHSYPIYISDAAKYIFHFYPNVVLSLWNLISHNIQESFWKLSLAAAFWFIKVSKFKLSLGTFFTTLPYCIMAFWTIVHSKSEIWELGGRELQQWHDSPLSKIILQMEAPAIILQISSSNIIKNHHLTNGGSSYQTLHFPGMDNKLT